MFIIKDDLYSNRHENITVYPVKRQVCDVQKTVRGPGVPTGKARAGFFGGMRMHGMELH